MNEEEIIRNVKRIIEEKNVAINKMSKDISRQLKEIEKLNFENHMLKKWNEQLDRNCISKDKIREKMKEIEDNMILFTNDKEKFNRYKYVRNILEELLKEK